MVLDQVQHYLRQRRSIGSGKANRIAPDLSDSESDEDISERVEQSFGGENESIHANKQSITQGSAPSIGSTAYYAMLQSKIQNLKNAVMPSDVQSLDVHPVECVREQASGTVNYRTVGFHVPKMDPNPAWERPLSLCLRISRTRRGASTCVV